MTVDLGRERVDFWGGAGRVARAVDGTAYEDRAASSLGFAAFLENCYADLSGSLVALL
jgi:hypothetical protein